jgi:hypothetical protein
MHRSARQCESCKRSIYSCWGVMNDRACALKREPQLAQPGDTGQRCSLNQVGFEAALRCAAPSRPVICCPYHQPLLYHPRAHFPLRPGHVMPRAARSRARKFCRLVFPPFRPLQSYARVPDCLISRRGPFPHDSSDPRALSSLPLSNHGASPRGQPAAADAPRMGPSRHSGRHRNGPRVVSRAARDRPAAAASKFSRRRSVPFGVRICPALASQAIIAEAALLKRRRPGWLRCRDLPL